MPLDAICLAAVREELAERITGSRIDKVQQPERDMIILALRGGHVPQSRLLISAGAGDPRAHITEYRFDNPASPPMFCMLLRKHLTGARIAGVTQPPAERVLEFSLEAPDLLGDMSEKRLILELIGRRPNVILTDHSGLIIDCLRRVGGEMTDSRAVLPGLFYRPPPPQAGKLDPLSVTEAVWRVRFDVACDPGAEERRGEGAFITEGERRLEDAPGAEERVESGAKKTVDYWLLSNFTALSPLICRELSWRAYGETDFRIGAVTDGGAALYREFSGLMKRAAAGDYEPNVIVGEDGAPLDFSYTRILQYEDALDSGSCESFSALLDSFYTKKSQSERIRQRSSAMLKTVAAARERLVRKLAAQASELEMSAGRSYLRECGDIITSNLHMMKQGQSALVAPDYYENDGRTREIKLDPLKTPQQNAAKYYRDYARAKNAEKFLTEQIKVGETELVYLESALEEIERAESETDLIEIRSELISSGYIKEKREKKDKEKPRRSAPLSFTSSSGLPILAGRSNTQNDELTLKTASKTDVWLHAKGVHGAHVVISCGGAAPDEKTLSEAAAIAAYYSSARSGGRAAVDYTLVKYVKRRQGGRPGMVIYTDHKTITASPDESLVAGLRNS